MNNIEVNDTVRIAGDRRNWIAEIVCATGARPYICVSHTRTIGRDTRVTQRDVHPDRVTLIRKGNAEDDFVDTFLATLPALEV